MGISPILVKLFIACVHGLAEDSLNQLIAICNEMSDEKFLNDLKRILVIEDYEDTKAEISRRIEFLRAEVNSDVVMRVVNKLKRVSIMSEHFFIKGLRGDAAEEDFLLRLNFSVNSNQQPYSLTNPFDFRQALGRAHFQTILETQSGVFIIRCNLNQPLEGADVDIADVHVNLISLALDSRNSIQIDIQTTDLTITGWVTRRPNRK